MNAYRIRHLVVIATMTIIFLLVVSTPLTLARPWLDTTVYRLTLGLLVANLTGFVHYRMTPIKKYRTAEALKYASIRWAGYILVAAGGLLFVLPVTMANFENGLALGFVLTLIAETGLITLFSDEFINQWSKPHREQLAIAGFVEAAGIASLATFIINKEIHFLLTAGTGAAAYGMILWLMPKPDNTLAATERRRKNIRNGRIIIIVMIFAIIATIAVVTYLKKE